MKHIKRGLTLMSMALFILTAAKAQTKVFKEVAEGISSQFEVIVQDDKLVGYLGFTQLEQVSADSFNYHISIMDENLNDIGSVNFREQKLTLRAVSFESDVLCLAYLKSNFQDMPYHNKRDFKEVVANARSWLFTQFISLDGKIAATNNLPMTLTPHSPGYTGNALITATMKHEMQLRNIPGIGFACMIQDEQKNTLSTYSTAGKLLWKRDINEGTDDLGLQTSKSDVNLLVKKRDLNDPESGYTLLSYNASTGDPYPKFIPTDRKGNHLKILGFGNDPVTGDVVLSGMIIDPKKCIHAGTGNGLHHGIYCGVFSIDIQGHTKKAIQANFSYWNDESNPVFSKRGYIKEAETYDDVQRSFRDYQGNTWYAGTGIHPRFRTGGMICGAVFFEFLLIPTFCELGAGFYRYRAKDVVLLKMDPKGKLTYENAVPTEPGLMKSLKGVPFSLYETSSYYSLTNPETKTDYLVVSDPKNVTIYNVEQKKVARTIPVKEHKNTFRVLPAKEGYYMVSEYNKKEKTTRLSIEAL